MVSKKKIEQLQEIKEQIKAWPVIGVIDMLKLPARQLLEIRQRLKGKAKIKMYKKSLIIRAFNDMGVDLKDAVQGEPALIFSKENPFDLAKLVAENKSYTKAKEGDILSTDVWIRAGPTGLAPGPAIGQLQKFGLQVGVEGEKIVVKTDKMIAKAGDKVSKEMADLLQKLGIKPIELMLNIIAIWDGKIIYPKDILFKTSDEWLSEIVKGFHACCALALALEWPITPIIPHMLSNANQHALALALSAGIETKETIPLLLTRAYAQAGEIKKFLNIKE
ncbi:MAG: 50S ribosomal protein L10 [Candidatus Aenigmatarchaeota archaeon]